MAAAPDESRPPCVNPQCQRRIRQLEEELIRVKSVGYDMLKQRGGWQVAGTTPTESSLNFNDLFDHEVEELAKSLKEDVSIEEDKARWLACREFQKIYRSLKSIVFTKLVETLSKVFLIGSEKDSDEQLYDICRAFGLLLNASGIAAEPAHEDIATQATNGLLEEYKLLSPTSTKLFTSKSAQLSWDLLTTVPPLLSITPPGSQYFREWHEKELAPTWKSKLSNYELVYYRPILFMSCEGKVTRKGWVGNKDSGADTSPITTPDEKIDQLYTPEKGTPEDTSSCGTTTVILTEKFEAESYKPRLMHTKKHTFNGTSVSENMSHGKQRETSSKYYQQTAAVMSIKTTSSAKSGGKQMTSERDSWSKTRRLM